jgi:hypothetical protein
MEALKNKPNETDILATLKNAGSEQIAEAIGIVTEKEINRILSRGVNMSESERKLANNLRRVREAYGF